jgi:hypothetical protein
VMENTNLIIPSIDISLVTCKCRRCGKLLTDPKSVIAGIGPTCAAIDAVPDERGRKVIVDAFEGDITCRRDRGMPIFNIEHTHRHHSPSGMEWGYYGSGAADFALNVLALFTPQELINPVDLWDGSTVSKLAWDLHQDFKNDFVGPMNYAGGTITREAIVGWIETRLPEPEPQNVETFRVDKPKRARRKKADTTQPLIQE